MSVGGPGVDSAEGADVDDAAAGSFEMWLRGLGGEEGRAGVGLEHRVPLLDGDGVERGGLEDSGVVDEDVEASEVGGNGVDGVADAFRRAEVARVTSGADAVGAEFGDGALGFGLGFAIGDGDVGSAGGEGEGERFADSFRRAGNQRGLVL